MTAHRLIVAAFLTLGVMLAPAAGLVAAPLPLRLTDPLTGKPADVTAAAGVLHVVFFATWCPPCVEELEALAELEARWEERGYRLVLIAVRTRHTGERLKAFAAEHQPPGRLLFDVDGSAQKALRGDSLPTHVVFDSAGQEAHRAAALAEGVEATLRRLLAGRKGAER